VTDEKCRELYSQLVELLNNLGLRWVIELTEQEISSGKLIQQQEEYRLPRNLSTIDSQLEPYPKPISVDPASRRRSRMSLMVIENSESDKLKILLSFIKQAVADTTLYESKILKYFGDESVFGESISRVRFVDMQDDQESHELSLDNVLSKEDHAHNLNNLINQILQEIDNDS
jgi:hypothetical protein